MSHDFFVAEEIIIFQSHFLQILGAKRPFSGSQLGSQGSQGGITIPFPSVSQKALRILNIGPPKLSPH